MLWGRSFSSDPRSHNWVHRPVDTYEVLQTCKDAVERSAKKDDDMTKSGYDLSMSFYSCLPDTVDPRGPKGPK